jgi:hypothetical protein
MRKLTKLILALAFPAAVLAGGNANAGMMITDWNYENLFGFASYTSSGPMYAATGSLSNPFADFSIPGGPNPNPAAGMATQLTWGQAVDGNPANRSSFTLSGNAGVGQTLGTVQTNGANAFDVTLTHKNHPIYWDTLTSATMVGSLMLQATAPAPFAGLPVGPLTGVFSIVFKETPNSGHCPDNLDLLPGGVKCPDIFVLDPLASSALQNVFLFSLDGYSYFLNVDISGLQNVGPESCAAVLQAPGCLGFVTPENQSTPLSLSFNIKAVPEPGVLALLGLGLVGLGFSRTRRRSE